MNSPTIAVKLLVLVDQRIVSYQGNMPTKQFLALRHAIDAVKASGDAGVRITPNSHIKAILPAHVPAEGQLVHLESATP